MTDAYANRGRGFIFIFKKLLRDEYPMEWLALYFGGRYRCCCWTYQGREAIQFIGTDG